MKIYKLFMTEQAIQEKIFSSIKSQFEKAGLEISVLNRCIDIAYLNADSELITIEIKLRDWRTALKQALDHQLYADRAYIYLPKPRRGEASPKLIELLNEYGIGLVWFKFDGEGEGLSFEELVVARKSLSYWPVARKKIESMLYA